MVFRMIIKCKIIVNNQETKIWKIAKINTIHRMNYHKFSDMSHFTTRFSLNLGKALGHQEAKSLNKSAISCLTWSKRVTFRNLTMTTPGMDSRQEM
jgi:hypothetical protein